MSYFRKDVIDTVETGDEFNDIYGNIISHLLNCPTWSPVPYRKFGLYDHVAHNFKKMKSIEGLPNQEQYQWIRINEEVKNRVYLTQPNKKAKIANYTEGHDADYRSHKYYSKYENVARLDLFWYHSLTEKVQAISFGDSKNVLKPFKILNHEWKLHGVKSTTRGFPVNTYYCKNCEIMGISKVSMGITIIQPQKFLSCEECQIEDILE